MKSPCTTFRLVGCALIACVAVPAMAGIGRRPQANAIKPLRHIVAITLRNSGTVANKVEAALVGQTAVPLRWPTFLPGGMDGDHPRYVNLLSADKESYDIELGWSEDCVGGNYCHEGTVRGSSQPLVEEDRARTAVLLQDGIQGYFINFTCGADCDDAAVGWTENGYHYSISLKAGKKQTLIRMANSAIAAGREGKAEQPLRR